MKIKHFILVLAFSFCWHLLLQGQTVAEARHLIWYSRPASAILAMEKIIQHDPANAEALFFYTIACAQSNNIKSLQLARNLVLPDVKQVPYGQCALGEICLFERKNDSATFFFNEAMQKTKQKNADILFAVALANIETQGGDLLLATSLLQKAIQKDKVHASLYYVAMGNAYMKLHDGNEAYKAYSLASKYDPRNPEAPFRLGTIFASQDNSNACLKYFNQSIAADSLYSPAWHALYTHYYFSNPAQAMICFKHYVACSDPNPSNDYLLTDLLYLNKKYAEAVDRAKVLISQEDSSGNPRLYKLIAYCYKELKDTAAALHFMRQYFNLAKDSSLVLQDFETMAEMYAAYPSKYDSAAFYYSKVAELEKDASKNLEGYKKIIDLYKQAKEYDKEAYWLGVYYNANKNASNLDLFNWGVAEYFAGNYRSAADIFSRYIEKYPDQAFGYCWKARSNAAIDTSMESGIAVPDYVKVIEVAEKDSANTFNKKALIESYGYIAAYKANIQKDYPGAIEEFERLIQVDPNNSNARRYLALLKRNMTEGQASNGGH